jgi:uncharacterized protein (DUF1800 family)
MDMKPSLLNSLARVIAVTSPILLGMGLPGARLVAQETPATVRDSAVHALNRLAYGPMPGQVERVVREGVWRWIERQLAYDQIDNRVLEAREDEFALLDYSREELSREFVMFQRERRQANSRTDSTSRQATRRMSGRGRQFRMLGGQVGQLVVVRAAVSNRQLQEVMVDFWTNHFNVYLAKGLDRVLLPAFIEETIRPNALGRFEDLLVATARDPAMLFYLDNIQSVTPGAMPPQLERHIQRMNRGQRGRGRRNQARADSLLRRIQERLPRGLNENYARELLELHTLGVDGGYTQADVVSVARILTGWSIARPEDGVRFEFHEWAHDRDQKEVLGVTFPGDRGQDEGRRLLALLANHPSTARHISTKLCQRLVADTPPLGCIDTAVGAWERTDGNIREVVRAILLSPDFWAPSNRQTKIKTPLEFTVSAVRVVGATTDDSPGMARVVARLGQPLYLQPAPTGYPETQTDWVNSGALLNRMNIAMALANNSLPGITVDLDQVVPVTADVETLLDAVDGRILSGSMSLSTRRVIREELAGVGDPSARRALAVGLAIGGPEFQRQ